MPQTTQVTVVVKRGMVDQVYADSGVEVVVVDLDFPPDDQQSMVVTNERRATMTQRVARLDLRARSYSPK